MAIQDTQKVDYLWKKLGYGVAKTDTIAFKRAYNESISSPLLLRGDKVWQDSDEVPTVKPSSSTSIVTIYDDSGNGEATVECSEDITSSDNRTWTTQLTDWIPPEFGPTYLVKVYIDSTGSTTPQTTGVQLLSAGSGNDDEWFFDYQAGVLHFIGENLPGDIAAGISGKGVYIVGARYSGMFGVGGALRVDTAPALGGDLDVGLNKIYTTEIDGSIVLEPNGTGIVSVSNTNIGDLADPVNLQDAATKNYVDQYFLNFNDDRIVKDDTSIVASATDLLVTVNNVGVLTITSTGIAPAIANETLVLETTNSVLLAKGTVGERPASPISGQTRYNTTDDVLEYYNGTTWVSLTENTIATQSITPDGTSDTYILNQEATNDTAIITINGVLQHVNRYVISGTSLTFTEIPLVTDLIDIRFLSSATITENKFRSDLTTAPTSGTAGQLGDYWINGSGVMYMHNGSNWYSYTGNIVS